MGTQQVPHRVAVLLAIEPVQGHAPGIGAIAGCVIKPTFHPRHKRVDFGLARLRLAWRWHQPPAQFADRRLPDLGFGGNAFRCHRVEGNLALEFDVVVAIAAVAIKERKPAVGTMSGFRSRGRKGRGAQSQDRQDRLFA